MVFILKKFYNMSRILKKIIFILRIENFLNKIDKIKIYLKIREVKCYE